MQASAEFSHASSSIGELPGNWRKERMIALLALWFSGTREVPIACPTVVVQQGTKSDRREAKMTHDTASVDRTLKI